MGTINYGTSNYITMGIRPADASSIFNDPDFREWIEEEYHISPEEEEERAYSIAVDVAREYDEEDRAEIEKEIEALQPLTYYHIAVKSGYYEGFYIDIESNYPVFFDDYADRAEAQKEVTKIRRLLESLTGCGLCSVWPGWCTTYRNREETFEDIAEAVQEMRDEIRSTPTWRQYERSTEA